jgi:hypothetical protein
VSIISTLIVMKDDAMTFHVLICAPVDAIPKAGGRDWSLENCRRRCHQQPPGSFSQSSPRRGQTGRTAHLHLHQGTLPCLCHLHNASH